MKYGKISNKAKKRKLGVIDYAGVDYKSNGQSYVSPPVTKYVGQKLDSMGYKK